MENGSREKLMEVMKSFRNAMLVTQASDKTLRSRPMALMRTEENGDMWFMTAFESGKVHDIETNPEVNVTMQEGSKFLSITGRGDISRDRAKIDELWSEPCKIYFPKGKDDPDLALIRVTANEGEYWDNEGVNRMKFLFEAVKAYVTGTTPDFDKGQHGSVSLKNSQPSDGQTVTASADAIPGNYAPKPA